MIQEARLFVDLAGVGADVGIPIADWLQEKERQRDEERARLPALDDLLKFRVDDEHSCTCEFNKNQCPVHNPDGDPEEVADDDV